MSLIKKKKKHICDRYRTKTCVVGIPLLLGMYIIGITTYKVYFKESLLSIFSLVRKSLPLEHTIYLHIITPTVF